MRVYNLGGIVASIFDRLDWAPNQSTHAIDRLRTFVDDAYMDLAEDAPYLFFDDEVRFAIFDDKAPTLATDLLRVSTPVKGGSNDAWVLESELAVGTASALVWETDRSWSGRTLLLKNPLNTTKEEWHHYRIQDVWTENVGGTNRVRVSLDRPWHNNTDTGIAYKVVSDEFALPSTLIKLKSMALVESETGTPWPLAIVGQDEAERAFLPNRHDLQTTSAPWTAYRREFQAPVASPGPGATVTTVDGGGLWAGPEPRGSFEYIFTYAWGKQEIWSHAPGPRTQTDVTPTAKRAEPYWESGPSPVLGPVTISAGAGAQVQITFPSLDFVLGFSGSTTERYQHSGLKIRIYRRRVSSTDTTPVVPSSRRFYLLDEVDATPTAPYIDDGSVTPDFRRPFREVHGYQTFRVWPMPDSRYELAVRATFTPLSLLDDEDMPRLTRDGVRALVERALMYQYEAQGEPAQARVKEQEYERMLMRLSKRYGDMRPSGRLRRRRTAKPRSGYPTRRTHYGRVTTS